MTSLDNDISPLRRIVDDVRIPYSSDPATPGRPKIFNAHLVAPIRKKRYRVRTEKKYLTERLPNY